MKEGRIKILKSYLNKRWCYGRGLRWMIEDEYGHNAYCDQCGNAANAVVRAIKPSGVYNIPFCKSHISEYFPEVENVPCIVEYVNKNIRLNKSNPKHTPIQYVTNAGIAVLGLINILIQIHLIITTDKYLLSIILICICIPGIILSIIYLKNNNPNNEDSSIDS